MNVLLLAMSVLPRTVTKSKILWNGQIKPKDYIGQLEPVPMMLFDTLEKQLDRIIVLESEETLIKNKVSICSEEMEISAVEYFKKRMIEEKIVSEDKIEDIIIDIKLDKGKLQVGMGEAVSILRDLKNSNKNDEFNLYIDMHGGPRDNQLISDAIISLLRAEGIFIKESYTVRKNSNEEFKIESADDSMMLFEFVAGMNEFLNYARSTTLERLTNKNENLVNTDLISCIREVCDSIQLCKMDDFKEKLSDLKTALSNKSGTYMDLFISTIGADYGVLLDNPSLVDILMWCIKKEFYQQALTIVESMVPQLLFKGNVISTEYDCEKVDPVKEKWKPRENFIFEKCIYKNNPCDIITMNFNSIKIKINGRKVEVAPSEYTGLLRENGKKDPDNEFSIKVNENVDEKYFFRFTRLHLALKNQRNLTNHAVEGERPSLESVKGALTVYVKCLENMLASCENNTSS